MQTAWRLAGDAELQHAAVLPLRAYEALKAAASPDIINAEGSAGAGGGAGGAADGGDAFWRAAVDAARAQAAAVGRARRAYLRVLRLQPRSAYVWANVSSSYVQV